jgi:GNAT superfamily N-acetyltransferase
MIEQESSRKAIVVRVITSDETWPLRLAVLRPNRPIEAVQYPGDDARTTRHFGAFREGRLLGIASLYLAEMPERPGVSAIQLRGMATAPEARGLGLGRALVHECIAFTRGNGVQLLWCNARTSAVGFYCKLGLEIVGEEFEIPDVGPHFRMLMRVTVEATG